MHVIEGRVAGATPTAEYWSLNLILSLIIFYGGWFFLYHWTTPSNLLYILIPLTLTIFKNPNAAHAAHICQTTLTTHTPRCIDSTDTTTVEPHKRQGAQSNKRQTAQTPKQTAHTSDCSIIKTAQRQTAESSETPNRKHQTAENAKPLQRRTS